MRVGRPNPHAGTNRRSLAAKPTWEGGVTRTSQPSRSDTFGLGISRPWSLLTGCCACRNCCNCIRTLHRGSRSIRRPMTGSQTTWRFCCLLESPKKSREKHHTASTVHQTASCVHSSPAKTSDTLHQGGSCPPPISLHLPCLFPPHRPRCGQYSEYCIGSISWPHLVTAW